MLTEAAECPEAATSPGAALLRRHRGNRLLFKQKEKGAPEDRKWVQSALTQQWQLRLAPLPVAPVGSAWPSPGGQLHAVTLASPAPPGQPGNLKVAQLRRASWASEVSANAADEPP
jgi:hypothetical protein